MPFLSFNKISKHIPGVFALDGVSFEIERGSWFSVLWCHWHVWVHDGKLQRAGAVQDAARFFVSSCCAKRLGLRQSSAAFYSNRPQLCQS
jgi:hypothetical protein